MNDVTSRIGLVVSDHRSDVAETADRLTLLAKERGIEVFGIDETSPPEVDVVVGIGGDGTLLHAGRIAYEYDLPIAGVNLGTVGYLTEFDPDHLGVLLDAIEAEPRTEHGRMTIEATTSDGASWHGINDVVLEKVISQRVVTIAVSINDAYFTTYRADGIIVATPLGSTAYSLSAGGPVLDPALHALVLTPVAPHSLMSRSIVLAPTTTIEFSVASDRPVRMNLDGHEAALIEEGAVIRIREGKRPVRFLTGTREAFPQPVRKQFGLDHA